jgi:DNA repair exonuclease SbcCD ATPase subunit
MPAKAPVADPQPITDDTIPAPAVESAIVVDAETTALSRWEALASDIAYASTEADGKVFDYQDKWDNKQARSWVAQLRKLKGRIERCRKDAKSVHLERGRAVDETARTLEAAVQGLIEPHEREIKALEAIEQARIDSHKAVLERIAALPLGITTAAEAEARLAELEAIDTTGMEEFAAAAAARQAEASEQLQGLRDTLRQQEAERAELEALRAEKVARDEAERLEQVRQQAITEDRARQDAERQAAAAEAARREADALAAAEAAAEIARRAQEATERRAAELEAQVAAAAVQERALHAEARRQAEAQRLQELDRQEAREATIDALRRELAAAIALMKLGDLPDAIIDGTLHQAISIDWRLV